ncbi:MAG: GNAT family protein [Bacteroidales bacterium]|jgi:ribosomal-protein-alanine N-acetyltransferase|nr:GNAT family protein [Bacteroidales bacterium]
MVIKLETERLILRKPRMSDIQDHFEGINDLSISKNLMVVAYPYKKKDSEGWIKECIKSWKKKNLTKYYFFIELKSEKKMIGALDISVNSHNKIGTTGSWINRKYQKKGYMTEAKIALNEFAFNELGLRKLETGVYTSNKGSTATQERVGYKYEGMKRKHALCKATGKIHDENIYGMMKSEWKKVLPKLKKYLKAKIKKLND